MIEHVIGIDPGLDGIGVAWLSREAGVITVRETHTVRTKAALSMGVRLKTIQQELADLLGTLWTTAVLTAGVRRSDALTIAIEIPGRVGSYKERTARGGADMTAAGMSKFWQALGVIRAVAADTDHPVVDIPPGGAKKEARQAMFQRWTKAGRNADERDAIVIACVQLFTTASTVDLARATARR